LIDTPFIDIPAKLAPGGAGNVICKFRISENIGENLTFTFRAGFPNKTGGVTYFGDRIDILVNSGTQNSKPQEKAGGLGGAGGSITPGGGGGFGSGAGVGGTSIVAKGISGGNVGGGNPPPVAGIKKMLTKEEY
jgi:hypothetical protein